MFRTSPGTWHKGTCPLHIEAAAASRDTERVVRDMRYHPSLSGKSEDYIAGWDAAVSLIDTLGEGADPNRPVRVLADHYPTIKP